MPTGPRTNRQIRATNVRILDQDGQQVGVMPIEEALRLAEEAGLDLIEVAGIRTILSREPTKHRLAHSRSSALCRRSSHEIATSAMTYFGPGAAAALPLEPPRNMTGRS